MYRDGRKRWMGQPRVARSVPPAPTEPTPGPEASSLPAASHRLTVPVFPMWSPPAISQLFGVGRTTVQYWMDHGKISYVIDSIQDRYVLRAELVRFAREYLNREVQE